MQNLSFQTSAEMYNGVKIPLLGYSAEEHAYNYQTQVEIFEDAIDVGFRYFDLRDEDEAFRALRKAIKNSGIPRENFFVAARMRQVEMRCRFPVERLNEDMQQFGAEDGEDVYFDLFSLPWPMFDQFLSAWCGRDYRKEENYYPFPVQSFYKEGLVRAIGVCNFEIHHLKELMNSPRFEIMPMINQSHFHPLFTSPELRKFCAEKGILFGGLFEENGLVQPTKPTFTTDTWRNGEQFETDEYAKIANRTTIRARSHSLPDGVYMKDPIRRDLNPRLPHFYYDGFSPISKIAKKHEKTNLQVVTRWSLQHGVVTLAKTIWRKKMEEYADVFSFSLDENDMAMIDALNADFRIGYNPDYIDF